MTKRERLVAQIKHQQEAGGRFPIVSLDEFFDGNDDFGSIGCNLDEPYKASKPDTRPWLKRLLSAKLVMPVPNAPHPGPQGFYEVLRTIRARDDVQEVLVEIRDFHAEDTAWPFSDRIYILTMASMEEVESWVASLFPTEIFDGYEQEKPALVPDLLSGYRAYTVWWD